ncbi:MAG: fumarate hydratase [Oscillospiraceae bacterium]|jgi:tartrate dehydratase alpha subunit/fumarate hydratase class I-like protein|nr:fumarate hydratase [Oscillospiraceae bacterium]
MREYTTQELTDALTAALRRAQCVLAPDRAILLECAFEASGGTAADKLSARVARFGECADKSLPLLGQYGHLTVFADTGSECGVPWRAVSDAAIAAARSLGLDVTIFIVSRTHAGENINLAVTLSDRYSQTLEAVGRTGLLPDCDEFDELVVSMLSEDALDRAAPAVIGVGIGETTDDARTAARTALARSVTASSEDPALAERERRLLARINRSSREVRLGSSRVTPALSVAIEASGGGVIAVMPADPFVNTASVTI